MIISGFDNPAALYNIMFVCSGNTCRSPIAEAFARDWVRRNLSGYYQNFHFSSAGISAWNGCPASPEAIEAARRFNLNLSSHRSRRFTDEVARGAIVLTMTRAQSLEARRIAPAQRCMTLADWTGRGACDISDPFMASLSDYIKCFTQIKDFVESGLKRHVRA